jgi:hypothetical protein
MSPGQGLDPAGRAGQCARRGLVIDLSWTRRIPAPVTCLDHQAVKSACAAFHLQRPRYWLTLNRGAGNSRLPADGNPGNWTDVPAD